MRRGIFASRAQCGRRQALLHGLGERLGSLEIQPKTQSRAVALEVLPAQTGVEAAEAENEAVVQILIDSEIDPAPEPQARRPALLARERFSARAGLEMPPLGGTQSPPNPRARI